MTKKITDPLTQATTAHRAALDAQRVMREAAGARDAAVRAARAAGHSVQEIADSLGVDRQRVYQMLREGK